MNDAGIRLSAHALERLEIRYGITITPEELATLCLRLKETGAYSTYDDGAEWRPVNLRGRSLFAVIRDGSVVTFLLSGARRLEGAVDVQPRSPMAFEVESELREAGFKTRREWKKLGRKVRPGAEPEPRVACARLYSQEQLVDQRLCQHSAVNRDGNRCLGCGARLG